MSVVHAGHATADMIDCEYLRVGQWQNFRRLEKAQGCDGGDYVAKRSGKTIH